jgi:amino acid transporter
MSDDGSVTGTTDTVVEGRPPERSKHRRNRELIELLTELRVALPGVQVLFAFLLTVPFTARFAELSRANRDAFFVAFVSSAAASAFLIAPSAYHRLRWRQADKERMLRVSNELAIAGIGALAVGITAVVYLITSLLYGALPAAGAAVAMAGTIVWLWYVLPFMHSAGDNQDAASSRGRRGSRGEGTPSR